MSLLRERPLVRFGDESLFVGRVREVETCLKAIDLGLNVVVTGVPGSGKSSLLWHLGHQLARERKNRTYVVSAPATSNASELMEAISEEIVGPPPGPATDLERIIGRSVGHSDATLSGRGRTQAAIARLRQHLNPWGNPPADEDGPFWDEGLDSVIFVDSPNVAGAESLFLGYANDLAAIRAIWVAALRSPVSPAGNLDRFFDVRLELSGMSKSEATELIQRRLGDAFDAVQFESTIDGSATQPRALVSAAREAALGIHASPRASEPSSEARDNAWTQVTALGRPAAMLVAEMRGRGPVSASDESLLSALGWSRSRASELLSRLYKAKLVSAATEANVVSGRPRKLYSLVPELES